MIKILIFNHIRTIIKKKKNEDKNSYINNKFENIDNNINTILKMINPENNHIKSKKDISQIRISTDQFENYFENEKYSPDEKTKYDKNLQDLTNNHPQSIQLNIFKKSNLKERIKNKLNIYENENIYTKEFNNNLYNINDLSNRKLNSDNSFNINPENKINNIYLTGDKKKHPQNLNKTNFKQDNLTITNNIFDINESPKIFCNINEEKTYDYHRLELLNHFVTTKRKKTEIPLNYSSCDIFISIICSKKCRTKVLSDKVKIFENLDAYLDRRFECKTFLNIYDEQKQLRNIVLNDNQNKVFNYLIKDFNDLAINDDNIEEEISKKIYDFDEVYKNTKKKNKFDENLFKFMEDSLKNILKN